MPRKYTPKPGAKTYKKYNLDKIKEAVKDISSKNLSIKAAAIKYEIPFSVLQRHNQRTVKPQGGPTALSPEVEEYIIKNLNICADWGYPMDKTDLRYIVKMYLDTVNITCKRFKNNFPGPDFIESFLNRHSKQISVRISQNIKRSRAEVSPATINEYFCKLEESLKDVPLDNIVNYDETNLSDDPGRPKVIVRRGCKYPERVANHSKASTSLMVAASAAGELLLPYVVYKATHLYDSWTLNGPKGTRYNRSASGWFDGAIFCDWVKTVAVPFFDKKQGKKVLIGDNLSSHISVELIEFCHERNIHFVFLPPNSTHLTQPLDVSFFRPMKMAWREILQKWKKHDGRNMCSVPKSCFPRLLKMLFDQLQHNLEKNIRSGFRKTGIAPLNSQEVLSRLPNEGDGVNVNAVDESFVTLLKEMRYGSLNISETKTKKKIEVIAGKSVDPDELQAANTETKQRKTKKTVKSNEKVKSTKHASIENKTKSTPNSCLDLTSSQKSPIPSTSYHQQLDLEAISDHFIFPKEDICTSPEKKTVRTTKTENNKNKGLGKKTKITTMSRPQLTPISLNSQLLPVCSSSSSFDIETMPVILEQDLFFSKEEICESTPTETSNNDQLTKNKKANITVLSDEIISSNKRKVPTRRETTLQKKPKPSISAKILSPAKRRESAASRNYYNNADEIIELILED